MNLVPMVLVNDRHGERSYDLYSRLLRDRIIMLSGEIDEQVAALVVSLDLSSCDVCTYAIGQCASMGCVILAAGTKGKRQALPSSRLMLHQVSAQTRGPVEDMKRSVQEAERLNDLLAAKLAGSTRQPLEKIKVDMDRDFFLSASEAVHYSLIDRVLSKKDEAKKGGL